MPITEAMACGAPVVASAHPSLDEACGRRGRARRPGEPEAIADGDPRGAGAARRAARARARARAQFSWRARRRDRSSRGTSDSRSARHDAAPRQTRAGTARYVRGLLDQLSTADVVEVRVPLRRLGRAATRRARHVRGTRACCPPRPGADVLHCPTFRGAVPRRARRSSSRSTTSPCSRHPEWFNRWTRARTRASPCRASCAPRRA